MSRWVLALGLMLAAPAHADDIAWLIATVEDASPAVRHAVAEVDLAEGRRAEANAPFEPQWVATASYNYGRGELLPMQVRSEEGKRFLFEQIDLRFTTLAANLQAELDAGPGPVSLDCGGDIILINGREICDPPDAAAERARFEALVEALERDASDPAVAAALRELQQQNTYDNRANIEQIIHDSEQIAASARQSRSELGVVPEVERRHQMEALFSWQRRFENGLGLSPSIGFDGVVSNFESKPRSPRYGGQGLLPAYRGGIGLTFVLPLGRGGGAALRAPRDAAEHALDAARSDHAAMRSLAVYSALQAYVGLAAARAQFDLARDRAERAQTLRAGLRALVEGDLMSASELVQADAQGAADAAAELQARSAVIDAERALRQVLGLPAHALLPTPDASVLERLAQLPRCTGGIGDWRTRLEQRPELDSLRARELQAARLLFAAQDGRRPRLDLSLTLAYAARSESAAVLRGLGDTFGDGLLGPSVLFSLEGDLEFRGRGARGRIEQALALQSQAQLQLEQRRRSETYALRQLAETLPQLETEYALRRRSAQAYRGATGAAETRLRAGEGALLEVLNSRSLADGAEVQALLGAEALARQQIELRWRLGGLLAPRGADTPWLDQASCGLPVEPFLPIARRTPGPAHSDVLHPPAVSSRPGHRITGDST